MIKSVATTLGADGGVGTRADARRTAQEAITMAQGRQVVESMERRKQAQAYLEGEIYKTE